MYGLILLVALGTEAVETRPADQPRQLRRYHEISRDLSKALRQEATAQSNPDRAAAIYQLTQLYDELKHDPRLTESETLTAYKNRLWGRLTRIKKGLQREFDRNDGRQLGDDTSIDEVTAGLTESLSLVGYSSGGPAHFVSHVRGSAGGGAIPDFGPELVALIERTIAPDFWDSAGGPGTIVYYAPLRVLVVRATSEVHHDLGGTLHAIRAAGM